MKASHIYINPQGVPCAPTKTFELGERSMWSEEEQRELKQSAIPIREEDQWWATYHAALKSGIKPDNFYPVEPYEFDYPIVGSGPRIATIIRPSEPKADPKEKELHRDYEEKIILWLNSNGFLSESAKNHSAAYLILEFESYLDRQQNTKDI